MYTSDSVAAPIPAEELSIDAELKQEMLMQARKKVVEKKMFKNLHAILFSGIHEKYHRVTNKGRKEFVQIEWKHFILREHEKDKDVITSVRKTKGVTSGGHSYVKDVDVSQRTIHYDYITVDDVDGNESVFRLQDMKLDKLPRDRLISLGWIYHSSKEPTGDSIIEAGGVLGQTWDGQTQPTIIVTHEDPEKPGSGNAQWFKADEFAKFIANTGIGMWHLSWVLPIASCFLMGGRYTESTGLVLSGIGISVAIIVKIIRQVQLGKQMKTFAGWLSDEINGFAQQAKDITKSIVSGIH